MIVVLLRSSDLSGDIKTGGVSMRITNSSRQTIAVPMINSPGDAAIAGRLVAKAESTLIFPLGSFLKTFMFSRGLLEKFDDGSLSASLTAAEQTQIDNIQKALQFVNLDWGTPRGQKSLVPGYDILS